MIFTCDMIVAWAPESTNALILCPLTTQLMYSMMTEPKLSGLKIQLISKSNCILCLQ